MNISGCNWHVLTEIKTQTTNDEEGEPHGVFWLHPGFRKNEGIVERKIFSAYWTQRKPNRRGKACGRVLRPMGEIFYNVPAFPAKDPSGNCNAPEYLSKGPLLLGNCTFTLPYHCINRKESKPSDKSSSSSMGEKGPGYDGDTNSLSVSCHTKFNRN